MDWLEIEGYAYKHYGDSASTELVSTVLPRMLYDTAELARRNPEAFRYVYAFILKGEAYDVLTSEAVFARVTRAAQEAFEKVRKTAKRSDSGDAPPGPRLFSSVSEIEESSETPLEAIKRHIDPKNRPYQDADIPIGQWIDDVMQARQRQVPRVANTDFEWLEAGDDVLFRGVSGSQESRHFLDGHLDDAEPVNDNGTLYGIN